MYLTEAASRLCFAQRSDYTTEKFRQLVDLWERDTNLV